MMDAMSSPTFHCICDEPTPTRAVQRDPSCAIHGNVVAFEHIDGPHDRIRAGEYWTVSRPDGERGAVLCCPSCARVFALQAFHHVDRDGVVRPSVSCACGWRALAELR